jgi:predicted acylesterase/phospholipase RssA
MAYWSALWADPDATPPPLADVAVQAMDVASVDRRVRARELADLVIDPVTPFGTLAFDKLDELIEVGREAGRQALASIDDRTRRVLRL